MSAERCEWCESVGPLWAEPNGGAQLCAECLAATVPSEVDAGAKDADDAAVERQSVTRGTLRALQCRARAVQLVMPFGRETIRARVRPQ